MNVLSSVTLPQTKLLTSLLRLKAVAVAATAAVPEAGALANIAVEEPLYGFALTVTGVFSEQTSGIWMETAERLKCYTQQWDSCNYIFIFLS